MIDAKKFKANDYLRKEFSCTCGRTHHTDLEEVVIGKNANEKVVPYLHTHAYKHIFLVADKHTYEAVGREVEQCIKQAGLKVTKLVLQEDEVVPDERTILSIFHAWNPACDFILAVGSGTINDMCKYVSYKMDLEYAIVASAPSMDGFASIGAALIIDNLKTTFDTHVPKAIFADVDVLCKAPMKMITAGLGDILGKYTCLCDWKLSKIINGEYYCERIVEIIEEMIDRVVCNADQVLLRSSDAIGAITEALIISGIAMSFVGNSRPASGSEHHISHYWEMKFLFEHKNAVLHGTKVGIGTIAILKLYEMLMKEDICFDKVKTQVETFDMQAWEELMKIKYEKASEGVIALEQKVHKNGVAEYTKRIQLIEQHWDEIKTMVQVSLPKVAFVEQLLLSMQAPYNPSQVDISYELMADSIVVAKEVRNRYGLLQLLWDLGLASTYGVRIADYFAVEQRRNLTLKEIKCFVLDMDGTIYLGNELFSYTKAFLAYVTTQQKAFYFFTNNSSKGQLNYIQKLAGMGITIEEKQMMISTHVIIAYLKKHHHGQRVYVVGTPALIAEFQRFDIPLDEEHPEIVILGFDTTLTYDKLTKACTLIRNGAIYYGINPDFNCPMEHGQFIPDCGSIARLIEGSTNRIPEYFGKPSPHTLAYMIEKTGYQAHEIAIIGDRLYTDIAVAQGSEVTSILVLSGECTLADVSTSAIQPDMVFPSLAELLEVLKKYA